MMIRKTMNIINTPRKTILRLRDNFMAGPEWVPTPPFVQMGKYRSVTAMALVWLYAYYSRLFTVPGRMVLAVSLVAFSYNLSVPLSPIRLLSFTLLGLFMVDFIMGFVFRPKIKIERATPQRVRAGTPFNIKYSARNMRAFTAWNLVIDDIHLPKGIRRLEPPPFIESLPKDQTANASSRFIADKRGKFNLPKPAADSAFPLGVFKWNCSHHGRQSIIAYPNYTHLRQLRVPKSKKYQKAGLSIVSKVGESMDFHGCRDFRVGDNVRHIHWPSSAKNNQLVVKEFQEEFLSRVALVLDTRGDTIPWWRKLLPNHKQNQKLEAAVALAAAIADFLARGDHVIDIFAAGNQIYHFKGGRGLANFDTILDILAGVQTRENDSLVEIQPEIIREISSIGSAFIILLKIDDQTRNLTNLFKQRGVETKTILVDHPKNQNYNTEDQITLAHPQHILNGDMKDI